MNEQTLDFLVKKHFGKVYKYKVYEHYNEMTDKLSSTIITLNKDKNRDSQIEIYEYIGDYNRIKQINEKYNKQEIIYSKEDIEKITIALRRDEQIDSILND